MSLPPIRTLPRSGSSKAFKCFNKTVLPEPLPPMIVVILPSSSSRLTPRSTCCLPNVLWRSMTRIMRLEHDRGDEIIPNQDHDKAEHDRLRRRLADGGGLGPSAGSLVAGDPGDDQ